MIDDDVPDDDADDDQAEPTGHNAASSKAYRTQKQRLRQEQKEAAAFWRGVFADPVGRREMWRLLQDAHTFEERFACGPNGFPQPDATWFHAGEQAFGLRLYQSWMLIDRAGVFTMHDEFDPRFMRPSLAPPRKD